MGRGDRYQQPSFTVPMPAGVTAWPLGARPVRAYCPLCDRPLEFCDCTESQRRRVAVQTRGTPRKEKV
jgi:hypothetical protein